MLFSHIYQVHKNSFGLLQKIMIQTVTMKNISPFPLFAIAFMFALPAFSVAAVSPGESDSGPIFFDRVAKSVASYTQKGKKKVGAMSAAELSSLGMSTVDGKIYSSSGQLVSKSAEYKMTTPNSSYKGMAAVTRYIYTGLAPRFGNNELELVVSKVALTLRAKGFVSSEMLDGYKFSLLYRWKVIHDDFQDPVLSFVKMKDPLKVYDSLKSANAKSWLEIAIQYMQNAFDYTGVAVYENESDTVIEYKNKILTALLRNYLADQTLEISDGIALFAALNTPEGRASDAAASRALFIKNLGSTFTPDTSKPGYEGFLTFVFPIAGSTKGPFNLPGEQFLKFGANGTFIESREWSDVWRTEFGGMPFMEVVDGVGFHGPITSRDDVDAWYLRRGYVSHGCFRMDASDVQELRAILPVLKDLKGEGVPLTITSWPDVTDWNNDGVVEAMDVGYYEIPTSANPKTVLSYLLPNAQRRYWNSHFKVLDGTLKTTTGETNSFDLDNGIFRNIPKYEVVGKRLKKNGFYDEVPLHTFPSRLTSVIQYSDSSVKYTGGNYEDVRGKYPPKRYNNLKWTAPKAVIVPQQPAQLPVADSGAKL